MKTFFLLLFTSSILLAQDTTEFNWYKTGIMYNLDIKTFQDSDGDGIGDVKGLISRLPYLDSSGFDIIWLSPFQPSPLKDDGYDVSDYYKIDKRLGTEEDFKALIKECNRRKIRILMDLVINHTSDTHPWFKDARKGPGSTYRGWYVWSKEKPKNIGEGMVFPGVQTAIWNLDSVSNEYYYHRFYKFQPDLNSQNAEVQKEIKKIIKHWIDLGISGFRLDAVPFYIEVAQTKGDDFVRRYEMLIDLQKYLTSLKKDAIILGEANVLPEENKNYFGENGEAMNMMFNFYVNQYLFSAFAEANTKKLQRALNETAQIPETAQWALFLRNHDELDLGRLSSAERRKVYKEFGPEENMQLYDRGLRRRMAPMLSNDLARLKFSYNVLFSLPSTPVVRYGEEIGMGENLQLHEREAVRTPMQWDSTKKAGFSKADSTIRPLITQDPFGYEKVNVKNQITDSVSLLNEIKRLIRKRNEHPQLSLGTYQVLPTQNSILSITYEYQGKCLMVIQNFNNKEENLKIPFELEGEVSEVLTNMVLPNNEKNMLISLPPYGSRWLLYK